MKKYKSMVFGVIVVVLSGVCTHDKAEVENWVVYSKNQNVTVYYDKDGIHYPYKTKGILGQPKTDKDIVRVWKKSVFDDFETMYLIEISCPRRTWTGIQDLWMKGGEQDNFIDPYLGNNFNIVPGTHWD